MALENARRIEWTKLAAQNENKRVASPSNKTHLSAALDLAFHLIYALSKAKKRFVHEILRREEASFQANSTVVEMREATHSAEESTGW